MITSISGVGVGAAYKALAVAQDHTPVDNRGNSLIDTLMSVTRISFCSQLNATELMRHRHVTYISLTAHLSYEVSDVLVDDALC